MHFILIAKRCFVLLTPSTEKNSIVIFINNPQREDLYYVINYIINLCISNAKECDVPLEAPKKKNRFTL